MSLPGSSDSCHCVSNFVFIRTPLALIILYHFSCDLWHGWWIRLQQRLSQLEIRIQYYYPLCFSATSFSEWDALTTWFESNSGVVRKSPIAAVAMLRRQMPGSTACEVSTTKVFLLSQPAGPVHTPTCAAAKFNSFCCKEGLRKQGENSQTTVVMVLYFKLLN